MVRPVILLALVALGACSSPGDLTYIAPPQIIAGPAVVADVTVTDKRDEKPNRIATIRGGYGNPIKVMDTTKPVATEVQDVFVKALTLRGMLRSGAPTHFEVVLHTLYGDQYMDRKVDLMFDLIVRDDTNRVVYSDRVTGKDYEFTFLDNGIFASIDTLGKAVQATLNKSVDEALDKIGLRNVLARMVPASPVS